ncbi:trypsin-like cysteine/serine peptidase domain-containing protein [Piptocephalis cylindrospora]|uniref:Trypsin-like cysteine/serine peptidase domain-containing protein n=1 Tax=Piptocephalis cylindrospora TaxID=1907219 RepID=A0A4P9Y4V8_9FUNG|nr:trypsin-like cysteine/serine peptidase domain-containing protein [Piptocephalis cylindrospora]|eukprot:RKP13834.1 trypsin-like cysteine/serine peptidase domain-containing protein [Piptocephalis cylindrospora]
MRLSAAFLFAAFQGSMMVEGAAGPIQKESLPLKMDDALNAAHGGNTMPIPPFGNLIIGGMSVSEGSFPYMAVMEMTKGAVHCGGVMIAPTWFLTAAHCFRAIEDQPFYIIAGSNKRSAIPYRVKGKSYLAHPSYQAFSGWDVGLVETQSPILLSSYARILPEADDSSHPLPYTALGWGIDNVQKRTAPDQLQQVSLMPADHEQCNLAGGSHWEENGFLCAGGLNRDTCFGDSGGPLLSQSSETGMYGVVGLTSFGANSQGQSSACGGAFDMGFYWDITPAIPWILQNSGLQSSSLVMS